MHFLRCLRLKREVTQLRNFYLRALFPDPRASHTAVLLDAFKIFIQFFKSLLELIQDVWIRHMKPHSSLEIGEDYFNRMFKELFML